VFISRSKNLYSLEYIDIEISIHNMGDASAKQSEAPFSYGNETLKQAHASKEHPLVSYGLRYPTAIKRHLKDSLNAHRAYLLISKSLATQTDTLKDLEEYLGTTLVGKRIGMKPHTFFSELIEILDDMRPLQPDCILTVGAGSLTDAAKILAWAAANDVRTISQLEGLSAAKAKGNADLKPPTIKSISVPTSLSGGEFTSFGGATNDVTKAKALFAPPIQNPVVVILDPEIASTTPESIWLSTGVRAIDHCVECACSLLGKPEADEIALEALTGLIPSLLRCKVNPQDLDARFGAQIGAMIAIRAASLGVPQGASHAIGHQLGPLGVGQ
jgi:alcohol dehydrogenase class IV